MGVVSLNVPQCHLACIDLLLPTEEGIPVAEQTGTQMSQAAQSNPGLALCICVTLGIFPAPFSRRWL